MKMTLKLISFAALALSMATSAFAVDAPEVVVTDDLLGWSAVDAVSINVHRENGEYIETLPGDATSWAAPASGSYFLVSTDNGDWQGWGRSNTVTVNVFVQSDPTAAFNSRTDSWSIDGSNIVFAVDGWFQVQREDLRAGYPTICEGVSTCEIADDNRYQIVNHNTGEVWQKVKTNPLSLTWRQDGLYRGNLYWNSVVYNYEAPVFYSILVDDELWATSDFTNTSVFGLERGTRYEVTIEAVLADGTNEVVAKQEILTDGPLAEVIPYGRPAATQDTFGFDLWDNVVERLQSFLPSDCLFALPEGDYCFSPSTRFLMEYNEYNTDGPIVWEYQLPGDNSTNHIEGLAHFYGTGARRFGGQKRFALVADVTTAFANSSYEISVFYGSGSFLGTFPILEDLQFSAGDGQERQINLDGADVRVTLGPVRSRDAGDSVYTPLPARRLHIAGEYYEPNGTGSLTDLSGWSREGAFLFVVDANTGETLTKSFYTGMTIDDVPVE